MNELAARRWARARWSRHEKTKKKSQREVQVEGRAGGAEGRQDHQSDHCVRLSRGSANGAGPVPARPSRTGARTGHGHARDGHTFGRGLTPGGGSSVSSKIASGPSSGRCGARRSWLAASNDSWCSAIPMYEPLLYANEQPNEGRVIMATGQSNSAAPPIP